MKLICGDSISELKTIEPNSIDALVTDPPAGISFMGKAWDGDKGGRKQWIAWMADLMTEAKRVLKPGGHALVWALPRTSHWTATALEDAGYEIRDVVLHLFGSGFPKSLDVGKAIDKAAGVEREIVGRRTDRAATPKHNMKGGKYNSFGRENIDLSAITAPATDSAKQWDGWGTALKPASEHWILARKPLSEPTVAANVLKWGTGGINIDGCRVGRDEKDISGWSKTGSKASENRSMTGANYDREAKTDNAGRFPSNVTLDQEAARMLDEQSGELSGDSENRGPRINNHPPANTYGTYKPHTDSGKWLGSGGASRFFYVAKPSRAERNDGLDGMEKKDLNWSNGTQNPNSFQEGESAPSANHHPTVKAVELMRYLCRLITPPKGLILDPFMGSGSTGIAAHEENFDFIGIEKEKEYFDIAKARIKAATAQQKMFA